LFKYSTRREIIIYSTKEKVIKITTIKIRRKADRDKRKCEL
jgi:hypothetical protein